jgi:ribose transport system substrate-binding protein
MKLTRLAAVFLLTLSLLPGCGRDARPRVGFVTNNAEEFWKIAEAGARKADQEFGVNCLYRRPQAGTADQQKTIIDDLLTQKVQAIAISVNNPKDQHDYLNSIADKVPLITQDNDAPDTKRVCYIGTDNYVAGKAAGDLVKEAMPEGGTVAIFVGVPDALNAQERTRGVLDALAGEKDAPGPEYGKYKLHGGKPFYDYVKTDKAKQNAADVLTALQNEKNVCLVGLWAYNPPAILSAVRQAGKLGQVKIVAFDEMFDTLRGVEAGEIHATVVQQPFEFGYQSVKMMAHLIKGDRSLVPANHILYIPHRIITRANAAEFTSELRKMLGK